MKVAICSDLHLEFHPYTITNRENAELLILAGDICTAKALPVEFFARASQEFKEVVYITGNHEAYGHDFTMYIDDIKENLSEFPNIHVLEKEVFDIGDYTVIGACLWSDMDKRDPLTIHAVEGMMNDFRYVKHSGRIIRYDDDSGRPSHADRFRATDALDEFDKTLDYTRHVITNRPDRKYIWAVHYGVSFQSVHPRFAGSGINGGFVSELSEFILDRPQIKLVVHGHVHDPVQYFIGDTRIVVNPRGYPGERKQPFDLVYLEV